MLLHTRVRKLMKATTSFLASGMIILIAVVGLTASAAMTVSEAITVLETVHPASAVNQTIKVGRKTIDVASSRGGLEFSAHADFANLDDDQIVYQGPSTKTRRSFAFLTIYCKGKRECVEVTSDGKWNVPGLLIETNSLDAEKVRNAIRTLIWLNQ